MHVTIMYCVLSNILSESYPTDARTLSNITADSLDIKFKQQPSSTITWSSVGDAFYGVVDRKLWLINSLSKTTYFDLDNLTLGEISLGAPKSIDEVWSMSFTSTDTHIYYVSKSATSELYQFDPSVPSYTLVDGTILVQQQDGFALHCLTSLKHQNDDLWYLYALGGASSVTIPTNSIYRYNISENSWQLLSGTLAVGRMKAGCCGIVDSENSNKHLIYVFGGLILSGSLVVNDGIEYCVMDFSSDLSNIDCSLLSVSMYEPKSRVVSLILNSHLIMLIGGADEDSSSISSAFGTIELLDTQTNEIYNPSNGFDASLNEARYNFFACFDHDSDNNYNDSYNTIYVAGGFSSGSGTEIDSWEIGCLYDTSISLQYSISNTPGSYEFDNNINYVCINDSVPMPTSFPTYPTVSPTSLPSTPPTQIPTTTPSTIPTNTPTKTPTQSPEATPSQYPTILPTNITAEHFPSQNHSDVPYQQPSQTPNTVSSVQPARQSTTTETQSTTTTNSNTGNSSTGDTTTSISTSWTTKAKTSTTYGTNFLQPGENQTQTQTQSLSTTKVTKSTNVSVSMKKDPKGLQDAIQWNFTHPNIFTLCSMSLIFIVISIVLYAFLHANCSSDAYNAQYRHKNECMRCMAYSFCCCGIINDSVKISGILLFFIHSHSFIIDTVFTIHLYLVDEIELAILSAILLFSSFLFSFLVFLYLRNEWIEYHDGLRFWLKRFTSFILKLTILTGSVFPVIELCNSRAFGFRVFKMGMTRTQLNKFRTWKLGILMTVENIPEIYISLRYFEINNGVDTLSLLTLIISVMSLIIDISMFIVRMLDSSNNDSSFLVAQIEVILEKHNFREARPRSQMFSKLRSSFAKAFDGKLSKHQIEILFVREIMTDIDQSKEVGSDIQLSKKVHGFVIELTIEIPEKSNNSKNSNNNNNNNQIEKNKISPREVRQIFCQFCDKSLGQELQEIWKIGDKKMKRQESLSASTVNIFTNVPKKITVKQCKIYSKERVIDYIREKSHNNYVNDNDKNKSRMRSENNLNQRKMNDSQKQQLQLDGKNLVGSLSSVKNAELPESPQVRDNLRVNVQQVETDTEWSDDNDLHNTAGATMILDGEYKNQMDVIVANAEIMANAHVYNGEPHENNGYHKDNVASGNEDGDDDDDEFKKICENTWDNYNYNNISVEQKANDNENIIIKYGEKSEVGEPSLFHMQTSQTFASSKLQIRPGKMMSTNESEIRMVEILGEQKSESVYNSGDETSQSDYHAMERTYKDHVLNTPARSLPNANDDDGDKSQQL